MLPGRLLTFTPKSQPFLLARPIIRPDSTASVSAGCERRIFLANFLTVPCRKLRMSAPSGPSGPGAVWLCSSAG